MRSYTAAGFVYLNDSLKLGSFVRGESTKVPTTPPYGSGNLVIRGMGGVYYQYPNGTVHNLDSLTDTTNLAYLSKSNPFTGRNTFADMSKFNDSTQLNGDVLLAGTSSPLDGVIHGGDYAGQGGTVTIRGGNGSGTPNIAGTVTIVGGNSGVNGGAAYVTGGIGSSYGGDVYISGGLAGGNTNPPDNSGRVDIYGHLVRVYADSMKYNDKVVATVQQAFTPTSGKLMYFSNGDIRDTNITGYVVPGDSSAWLATKTNLIRYDTITKGIEYSGIAAVDSDYIWECPYSNATVIDIRAWRDGGTTAFCNVQKDSGGTFRNLLSVNDTITTTKQSMATLQFTQLRYQNRLKVFITAITGTATKLFVQVYIRRQTI